MIKYEKISVSFRGVSLIDELSLEIPEKSKSLIVGKSGNGKSTLLAILLGFYKPDSGKVYFADEELTEENVWEIRKKIAYADQDSSLGLGKVSEWFDFVGSLKANQKKFFSRKEILNLFEFFELPEEIMNEKIETLSGGERQRLSLITAIALRRKVFLLDEPTASLDAALKKKVAEYFVSLNDATVVVISHDEIWREISDVKVFDMELKKWVR